MASPKVRFLGLKAECFRHPLDQEATYALQQVPGHDWLVRSLMGTVGETFFYLENLATGLLLGEQQLPEIYGLLVEASQILDLEPPQLYLRQNPVPNAYTLAIRGRQPFIVLHTALVELLNPGEIQAVIAHELGHLKCDHGVYLTLANLLTLAIGQVSPFGHWLAQGLQEQLFNWLRCAELSCDRAALLVTQEPRVVASVLMKLVGGSPRLAEQLNLDAFLAQARAYDRASANHLGEFFRQMRNAQATHPLPILRAREIDRWASSPTYQTLLKTYGMG